jgi:uncharacterized protein YndB with AHSA1/START domain
MIQSGSGSSLSVTTPSEREIVMTRVFDAPRALVFEAFTRPEHLRRWFGRRGDQLPVCDVDLRVGGAWRFVFQTREGGEMGMSGTYRVIEPPERLVYTETFDPPYTEVMGVETLNTLLLEEHDGKTTMTATSLYRSREERDNALQTGMADGATETFDRLAELLPALA